jgi:Sulfotransferase family
MLTTDKRIYFLHIQKTGGRDLMYRLIQRDDVIAYYAVGYKTPEENAHLGWDTRYITNDTYVFTLLREPVQRAVSHYAHITTLTKNAVYRPENEIDMSALSFDRLWEYLQEHPNVSRFMTMSILENRENCVLHLNSADQYIISRDKLDEKLSKMAQLIRVEKFTPLRFIQLRKDLHEFLGTSKFIFSNDASDSIDYYTESLKNLPAQTFTNKYSEDLYSKLTQSQLDMLQEYCAPDNYLYEKSI